MEPSIKEHFLINLAFNIKQGLVSLRIEKGTLKRAFAILFLISITLPFIGLYFWLEHERHLVKRELKHEMMDGIDKTQLVLLKFSNDQSNRLLKWKHSREFAYNGGMYDVVYSEVGGDSVSYWCWWDSKETQLNKQLSKLLAMVLGNDTSPEKRKNKRQLVNLFKNFHNAQSHTKILVVGSDAQAGSTPYRNQFTTRDKAPPVPPPRIS